MASWWARRWLAFAGARARLPAPLLLVVAMAWWFMIQHALAHGGHGRMSAASEVLSWMCMVIAMMLPFLGPTLAEVRRTTYPRLRGVAVAGYLAGWSLPWLAVALPFAGLRQLDVGHSTMLAGLAFIAAAAWTFTRWHRSAVAPCLVRPLAPGGLELLRSAGREGWRGGLRCSVSCGPLMIACALTGHDIVAMLGAFVLSWLERSTFRPSIRVAAALTLALGVWFLFPRPPAPHHHHHHAHADAVETIR